MAVRASFIIKPCELALRGALHRDQGLWAQAGLFSGALKELWGPVIQG